MNLALFFSDYFIWHYTRAFRDILYVWSNFFWFLTHFFSIPLLFRTLFSPFKRVTEEHDKPGLEDYFATIVVNVVTRVVGFFARFFIILFGLLALLVWCAVLVCLMVFWVLAPLVIAYAFLYGLSFILV